MYKLYQGIIKIVPTDKQMTKSINGELEIKDLKLVDSIQKVNDEDVIYFRLMYQESIGFKDDDFEPAYRTSPILTAKGKEMRILLELELYHPVKVTVREREVKHKLHFDVVCVQDQTKGNITYK